MQVLLLHSLITAMMAVIARLSEAGIGKALKFCKTRDKDWKHLAFSFFKNIPEYLAYHPVTQGNNSIGIQ